MRVAIAVLLVALAGCGVEEGVAPRGAERELEPVAAPLLVNEDWRIVEMAAAHGAFTIEVEAAEGVDTDEVARALIQPLQARYAEVLVYFHLRGAATDLPRVRVQWTASGGYTATRYPPAAP